MGKSVQTKVYYKLCSVSNYHKYRPKYAGKSQINRKIFVLEEKYDNRFCLK